jgi:hypothetical protein
MVQALARDEPPDGPPSFARFLWFLRGRKLAEAAAVAPKITDVPRVWRPALVRLAEHLESRPTRAPQLAQAFARAAIFSSAGMLESLATRELEETRTENVEDSYWIDLYTATTLLAYGRSQAAAGVVTPRIVAGATDPLVVYVAAHAAMKNAGANNVSILIDGHLGKGALDPSLARDLRDVAIQADAHDLALAMSDRIAEPVDGDAATRVHVLHRLGRHVDAGKAAAAISPDTLKLDPFLQFAAAYGALVAGRPETGATVAAILADPAALAGIDPVLVIDALVRTGKPDEARATLSPLLQQEPYDAYTFHHVAEALGKSPVSKDLRDRLAAAASLADPRAVLRGARRQSRPRAPW